MKSSSPALSLPSKERDLWPLIFAGLFGGFLGLSLLKFGNPPIMEKWVTRPTTGWEFLLGYPWPIGWAYRLLALIVIVGAPLARRKWQAPSWLIWLPAPWLAWQSIAYFQSVDAGLSSSTVKHFLACATCFYLGFLILAREKRLWPFWVGLLAGFLFVLIMGWQQRFGGLEETRHYFFTYIYPQMKEVAPGYLKKISSNRIYATLFYPNALAGALLLLLPPVLMVIWRSGALLAADARIFLVALVSVASLACMFWSGSKGGWLLMLVLGVIPLLRLPYKKQLKIALITGGLLAGLAGFFWKYSAFFQKGATSVSARFDYWQAALKTARDNPVFGSGPGTFAIPYQKIKRPESEMSRLVHNDYLEQASDSGVIGCLAYAVLIIGGLAWSFKGLGPLGKLSEPAPGPPSNAPDGWLSFAIWLGLLGWGLQGTVEFSLYVPALAWPAFTFLGLLLGRSPVAFSPTLSGAASINVGDKVVGEVGRRS